MNDGMLPGMQEALRLTREGKLLEATSLLQRNLGTGSRESHGTAMDVESWLTDAKPSQETADPSEREPGTRDEGTGAGAPLRPAGRERRRSPKVSWPESGGIPDLLVPGFRTGFEVDSPQRTGTDCPGEYTEKVFSSAAGSRRYGLYVPTGYTGQDVPLVVMLHGCTQSAQDFARGTRMNDLAEEHTFIVAYPEQGPSANATRCWNWFRDGDQHRGRGEPEILAGITREVSSDYAVEDGGVYVAGLSAGGAMAAVMASLYPEVYSAVGVHSGLAPGLASDMVSAFSAMNGGMHTTPGYSSRGDSGVGRPSGTTPVTVFQGDRDGTVHPKNAALLMSHFGHDGAPVLESFEGQTSGGHSYTRKSFGSANGDGSVGAESWTVHGLAHAWSGGDGSGSYTDGRGPDASAEMVRFFMERVGK